MVEPILLMRFFLCDVFVRLSVQKVVGQGYGGNVNTLLTLSNMSALDMTNPTLQVQVWLLLVFSDCRSPWMPTMATCLLLPLRRLATR
jgi:deoxyribodipyrimidine photolyase-like uncharacterized protein